MKKGSEASIIRLRDCVEGLAVGDAFGDRFFINPDVVENMIDARALPSPIWLFTDDTLMALSVAENLIQHGYIDQGTTTGVKHESLYQPGFSWHWKLTLRTEQPSQVIGHGGRP